MARLSRFVHAQQGVYEQALGEIANGIKSSHWMWFVFPQLAGLGHSTMAERYAIRDLAEARCFLTDPLLGQRLRECVHAMLAWGGRRSAPSILGETDAMKFRSSMTLFEIAANDDGSSHFAQALDVFYDGVRDQRTLFFLTRDGG